MKYEMLNITYTTSFRRLFEEKEKIEGYTLAKSEFQITLKYWSIQLPDNQRTATLNPEGSSSSDNKRTLSLLRLHFFRISYSFASDVYISPLFRIVLILRRNGE